MLNFIWDPKITFGELASSNAAAWKKLAEDPPSDPAVSWQTWRKNVLRAIEFLSSPELEAMPVKIVVEVQLLLINTTKAGSE